MMLVQKPPSSFLPSSFPVHNLYHHRKNPSAPVVVQPTRTPGLLSLSMAKPAPTRQPQQQQRVNRSPKSKPATAVSQNRSPRPAPAEAQQPTPAPTPDKHVQAQAAAAKPAKDKMTRSTPPPQTAPGRRTSGRHPSPSIYTPSQAEDVPFANINSKPKLNSFDPFVVNSSDSDSDRPYAQVKMAPKLANPSGKLARRRQPTAVAVPATPTPAPAQSRPVPVPRANNGRGHARTHSAFMNLSRSAPIPASPIVYGAFPICDDTTDADGLTPPATPVKPRKQTTRQPATMSSFDNGPRTAPLSSTHGFPFGPGYAGLPSPMASPTLQRQRQHVRSPSEGVFNMSFDEDSSFSSSSDNASEELKMLFGLMPKRPGQGQSIRGLVHSANSFPQSSAASKAAKEALYASSLFQNSPSPDELPPPAF